MEFGRFFLPGPTEVRPEVLQAMLKPMVAHRSQACADLFARILPPLQALFGTGRTVHIAAAPFSAIVQASHAAICCMQARCSSSGNVPAAICGILSATVSQLISCHLRR